MKGIIFNLLEACVSREHGADAWDGLLGATGLDGVYTSLGNYPDDDLSVLMTAASEALAVTPGDVERWFGRAAIPLLADRYPELFEPHESTRGFVLTLNEMHQAEVRKLYPGAVVPEFDFVPGVEGSLVMGYHSARQLCAFAEGLLEGAAHHYGERVAIEQPVCMLRGDEQCVLEVAVGS